MTVPVQREVSSLACWVSRIVPLGVPDNVWLPNPSSSEELEPSLKGAGEHTGLHLDGVGVTAFVVSPFLGVFLLGVFLLPE